MEARDRGIRIGVIGNVRLPEECKVAELVISRAR